MKKWFVGSVIVVLLGIFCIWLLKVKQVDYGFSMIKKEQLISHRGGLNFPENTMLSVADAVEREYRIIEVDIKVTKDNIPVLCHENSIENLSNGSGEIGKLTLAELRRYDFGVYFYETDHGVLIPTLEEFMDYMFQNRCVAELDLVNDSMTPEVLNIVYETVKKQNMLHNTIFTVTYEQGLHLAKIDNSLIFCISGVKTMDDISRIQKSEFGKAIIVSIPMNHFNVEICNLAHKRGFLVRTWTVNDVDMVLRLIRDNCDLVITDTVTKDDLVKRTE